MAELQKDPITRGDFLGFGVMGAIMGTLLTIPPVAYLLGPVIDVDVRGRSNVSREWQEVGPVAEVPEDRPKVFTVEFPIDQLYGDPQIQRQFPETPRSRERFTIKNAIWLSWKAPVLKQGRQGSTGDELGHPRKPEFLNRKSSGFTPEEIREVERSINVLSNSCAHLGCPVRWIEREGEGEFLCPCHGGIYDINGGWVGGPPPRGMFRYTKFEVRENGRLYVKHEFDVEPGIPGLTTTEPYVI
ncbi:Cytochrome b6-f complex iron-sulfur subunit [Rubrobacter xylanophilus DSM 9941]|uniref:QcrA and Rieske domain-containing protein n=1 Tax=Rubrobacter xylanophilus TaxID=49319 RepID=UPI001C640CB9|nr:ubiquinol-cytochrome c reductase iron-sulfur subunit [Rubrobacter xylanophilus]QYJ15992.1 Cytochrome b6-f complex iron-sulfur subunit [Rubrobacter xylanophilus DSM 9941]